MSNLTLDELIATLEEARMDLGGETEVYVAHQRSYPLSARIAAVTPVQDTSDLLVGDDDIDPDEGTYRLWLATEQPGMSDRLDPYAPSEAWDGASYPL